MASIITLSTMRGIAMHEWKGAGEDPGRW